MTENLQKFLREEEPILLEEMARTDKIMRRLSIPISLACGTAWGYISYKYLQPVSALYFVPLMVCGWYFFQSPRMGPIYLLHPILFAIHAILILAGVPLFFNTETFCIISVCLPYIVYGFLTYAISHIYSRYALKKLKSITCSQGDTADES